MKRKILMLVLCLASALCMSFALAACGEKPSEGLEFALNEAGTEYWVVGPGTCTDSEIVIPSTYNGKPVTAIKGTSISMPGPAGFDTCENLTSVVISDSVTEIGDYAFQYCQKLKSVKFGNNVAKIGVSAFHYCNELTEIELPASVTSIGNYAFLSTAENLEKIEVAAGNSVYKSDGNCLIEIATDNLIAGCKNSVIPEGVVSIGAGAFTGCAALKEIAIPSSVTSIEYHAFDGCENLNTVHIKDLAAWCKIQFGEHAYPFTSNSYFDEETYQRIHRETHLVLNGEEITDLEIPHEVTSIAEGAFENCTGLKSVTVGSGVTSIGSGAFMGCDGLQTVFFEGDSHLTEIESSVFSGCSGLTAINIPEKVTSIGYRAFAGCSGLTEITIPEQVTSIGVYMNISAFEECSGLHTVIWNAENCIEEYTYYTFFGCPSITTVKFGANVKAIPVEAFSALSELNCIEVAAGNTVYKSEQNCLIEIETNTVLLGCKTSIIPEGVTSIGEFSFSLCSGLTEIAIPNSVLAIEDFAFHRCAGLTKITIGNGLTSIGENAFWSCDGLENITVAQGNAQYSSQDGILYDKAQTQILLVPLAIKGAVTIPNGVTKIGDRAFEWCSGLTKITIPSSVLSIGAGAFESCSGLTDVTIENGVNTIESGAFRDCTGLTEITIPASVTSIGNYVFDGCDGLENITVEQGNVRYSSQDGILYDKAQTEILLVPLAIKGAVTIPNGVTKIGYNAFQERSGLTEITISASVTWIGMNAFIGCDGLEKVHFENPNGWEISTNTSPHKAIMDLEDPQKAAEYLTDTYVDYSWTRYE